MVYLYYISRLKYTILVGNPRIFLVWSVCVILSIYSLRTIPEVDKQKPERRNIKTPHP